jgi:hypothetical protein
LVSAPTLSCLLQGGLNHRSLLDRKVAEIVADHRHVLDGLEVDVHRNLFSLSARHPGQAPFPAGRGVRNFEFNLATTGSGHPSPPQTFQGVLGEVGG